MRSPSTLPIIPIPIPIPKLLGNLLNQLWMVQLERESHNSCGNEQLLFSFYCSDDWARKPYSLIELLLDDGFKLALKSVFSEIWVRTWVQVASNLWMAWFFSRKPLELMSWLRSKKTGFSKWLGPLTYCVWRWSLWNWFKCGLSCVFIIFCLILEGCHDYLMSWKK